jgi:asparaginyl-tRNA synthetase
MDRAKSPSADTVWIMKVIKRTKISEAIQLTNFGEEVNVKGWVRTRRGNKNVGFVALNDGSTINNIQIVIDIATFGEEFLKPITTGACINVNGKLVESQGQGQSVEIQATEIEIYGSADPATYPLQKKGHSLEFLREIAHLRPRTNTFGAIFRMRHTSPSRFINFITIGAFTIFIRLSSLLPMQKVPVPCLMYLP